MIGGWKGWLTCSVLAACLAVGLSWLLWRIIPVVDLALGWSVAIVNAVATSLINRSALVQAARNRPLWGVMANIFRVFMLLAILAIVLYLAGTVRFNFFLVAMLSGYFVFLFSEVLRLHKSTTKDQPDNE